MQEGNVLDTKTCQKNNKKQKIKILIKQTQTNNRNKYLNKKNNQNHHKKLSNKINKINNKQILK